MLGNCSAVVRWRTLVGAALLTSAALVSCGGGDSSTATTKTSKAPTSSVATPSAAADSPSASNEVYNSSELSAMLLSNVDVPGFDETDHDATDDDSSASGSPVPQKSDSTSGCKAVDQLSGEQSAGQHQASVTFGSKDEKAGKVVSFAEILMSEPTAILVPDLQKSVAARALFDQAYQHARVLLPD